MFISSNLDNIDLCNRLSIIRVIHFNLMWNGFDENVL